jgi:serine/threonine protein kinase
VISPSSCFRCQKPLAVESASGLCIECLEIADTINLTHATPQSAHPQLGSPAGSAAGFSAGNSSPTSKASQSSSVNNLPGLVDTTSRNAVVCIDPIRETVSEIAARIERETVTHAGVGFQNRLPAPPAGYDLIRRLGGGGMGDVFQAREHSTERVVAMKFLRHAANPTAVERFLTEVRALAWLEHPNIIKILATDFYREVPFFTMEFMNGGALSERVSAKGPLDPTQAATIMSTVARAIDAAHKAGVLHRDLKPSNILLGLDDMPKVADFGLAKRTDRNDELTINSGPIGTLGFMPPEQFSSKHGELGPAADVYGLGATLYYLLSGHRPYAGESPLEIAELDDDVMLERLRALRPDVPAELEAIVFKCLERDPAHRYTSAIALAEDLDRFLAGQVPLAPQLTRFRRLRRWGIRQRSYLAGAVAVLSLAAVLVALWPQKTEDLPAPAPETPVDLVEVIQKQLQAGKEVPLIGETGQPMYYRWRLGGGGFGISTTSDKSCYYESIGNTFLELIPDPGIDSYRVVLQLRQEGGKNNEQANDEDRSFIGPYFGYAELATTDGKMVLSMFALSFADTHKNGKLPASKKNNMPAQPINVVKPRGAVIPLDPQSGPHFNQKELKPFQFSSLNNRVGPWRTFQIDVKPKQVWVGWKDEDGTYKTVIDVSNEKLQETNAILQTQFGMDHPGTGILLPQWGPRMPIGIWSYKASVSVKNVTISPLATH